MDNQHSYNFKTLSERARFLFGKETLSDVQLAIPGRLFHGHKLILSMASPYFEEYFFKRSRHFSDQEKEGVMVFPITDTDPNTFETLLRSIYGEEINLESFGIRDVRLLYSAAKRYQVLSLEEQCKEYLTNSYVQPEIACQTFEMALKSGEMLNIEEACKLTFSEHTMEVFKSEFFTQSSSATVETIVKMNALNINSEMDVIEAVIKWGRAKFKQTQHGKANLRECILPLLIHVRFLTLENEVFLDFTNDYVDVLLSNEASAIMCKLCKGQGHDREIPNGLCSTTFPRQKPASNENYQFVNAPTTYQSDDLSDAHSDVVNATKGSQNNLINDNHTNDTTDEGFPSESKSFDGESLRSFTVIKTSGHSSQSGDSEEMGKTLLDLTETCDNTIKESFPKSSSFQNFANVSYKEKVDPWKPFSSSSSDKMPYNKTGHITGMKTQDEFLTKSSKSEFTSSQKATSSFFNPSMDMAESIRNSQEFLAQQKIYGSETSKIETVNSFTSPSNINMEDSDDDSLDEEAEDIELPDQCRAISIPCSDAQLIKGILTIDISSIISLTVNKGSMTVIGLTFELNASQLIFREPVTVVVNLKGRDVPVDQAEQVQAKKIHESFDFLFEKHVILKAPANLAIKATIDGLQLKHCKVCEINQFDGRDGKNQYTVDINSNQNSKGQIPCLVGKILYLE